jgi:hypothetical protein
MSQDVIFDKGQSHRRSVSVEENIPIFDTSTQSDILADTFSGPVNTANVEKNTAQDDVTQKNATHQSDNVLHQNPVDCINQLPMYIHGSTTLINSTVAG